MIDRKTILVASWVLSDLAALLFFVHVAQFSVFANVTLTNGEVRFLGFTAGFFALISLSDKVDLLYR